VLEGKAQAGAPLRVFRPITSFAGDMHAVPDDLVAAIETLAGDSAAKWGIGAARSEDPARPAQHDQVWLAAAAAGGALLDRYGIGLAILPASMAQGPHALGVRGRWGLVRASASPPAAVVYEWLFAPDVVTARARLFPPGGHGLDAGVIVLAGEGAQNQDEPGPPQPCTIERWAHGAIDLRCTAERPAYAVVSSSALPGWSVAIDGNAADWQTADVLRRAVALPAGAHRIAWRYWPPGLTIALVVAALGSAALIALWLVYGRDPHAEDRTLDPARADES